jgi:lysophospholipase L1-like esterase
MKDVDGRRLDTVQLVTSTLRPGMVPVSGTTNPLFALSNGTDVAHLSRFQHPVLSKVQQVSLVFANWYLSTAVGDSADGTPVEVACPNDIAVSCAITIGTRIFQLTVNGQTRWTIKPGGQVSTDPLDIDIDPAVNAFFYSRTYVEVAAASYFPLGRYAYTSGDWVKTYTSAQLPDGTLATNTPSGAVASVFGYAPIAALGTRISSAPITALIDDSITLGTGDVNATRGFASQALERDGIPYIKIARGAERAKNFGPDPTRRARRLPLIGGCTRAAIFYGTNDINAGGDVALTTETNLLATWQVLAARGMRSIIGTITPRTTSSDSWATTANQTPVAGQAQLHLVNNWIRDGAPFTGTTPAAVGAVGATRIGDPLHPVMAYAEIADVVMSARDSGIWKAGSTTDGVHPNSATHALMAAAISTALLT